MSETTKRILTGGAMFAVIFAAVYFGLLQWLGIMVVLGMGFDMIRVNFQSKTKIGMGTAIGLAVYWALFLYTTYFMSMDKWMMLLLFVTIAAADTGAWFFGRLIGGDLMWPRISPKKTWAGQIVGIISGTAAAMTYGFFISNDTFGMIWTGVGISLLSQYGDLAASAIKRKLKIKDFGNYLPGHGGLMDRFDGWIFAMPAMWLSTLLIG